MRRSWRKRLATSSANQGGGGYFQHKSNGQVGGRNKKKKKRWEKREPKNRSLIKEKRISRKSWVFCFVFFQVAIWQDFLRKRFQEIGNKQVKEREREREKRQIKKKIKEDS